jgi:hypothetical protein
VRQTFEDLGVICGATLTIALKPTNGGSTNDDLALFVDDGTANPATGVYTSRIYDLPNASPPVTSGIWDTTNNPTGSTFVLDLANLPPSGTNIINQISQAGVLDVLVEDDTAVDYMTLTTTCCPHQKCYKVKALTKPSSSGTTRTLEDQFGTKDAAIKLKPILLCTPVNKGGEDDEFAEKNHTVCYKIKEPPPFPGATVSVTNQFGSGQLLVAKPAMLCVPSTKKVRSCVGGTNAGNPCVTDADCPGGTCTF